MSTFLIRSASSQSSSYPIVLTRLGGPRSRPNPHPLIQYNTIQYNNPQPSYYTIDVIIWNWSYLGQVPCGFHKLRQERRLRNATRLWLLYSAEGRSLTAVVKITSSRKLCYCVQLYNPTPSRHPLSHDATWLRASTPNRYALHDGKGSHF